MVRTDMRFWDPDGDLHGFPTYPWERAPLGLLTRRQLRERGLCPGGRPPVAQLLATGRGGRTVLAWLYDLSQARPKRIATDAVREAVGKALTARKTCGSCEQVKPYVISTRLGECNQCAEQHQHLAPTSSTDVAREPLTEVSEPLTGRTSTPTGEEAVTDMSLITRARTRWATIRGRIDHTFDHVDLNRAVHDLDYRRGVQAEHGTSIDVFPSAPVVVPLRYTDEWFDARDEVMVDAEEAMESAAATENGLAHHRAHQRWQAAWDGDLAAALDPEGTAARAEELHTRWRAVVDAELAKDDDALQQALTDYEDVFWSGPVSPGEAAFTEPIGLVPTDTAHAGLADAHDHEAREVRWDLEGWPYADEVRGQSLGEPYDEADPDGDGGRLAGAEASAHDDWFRANATPEQITARDAAIAAADTAMWDAYEDGDDDAVNAAEAARERAFHAAPAASPDERHGVACSPAEAEFAESAGERELETYQAQMERLDVEDPDRLAEILDESNRLFAEGTALYAQAADTDGPDREPGAEQERQRHTADPADDERYYDDRGRYSEGVYRYVAAAGDLIVGGEVYDGAEWRSDGDGGIERRPRVGSDGFPEMSESEIAAADLDEAKGDADYDSGEADEPGRAESIQQWDGRRSPREADPVDEAGRAVEHLHETTAAAAERATAEASAADAYRDQQACWHQTDTAAREATDADTAARGADR